MRKIYTLLFILTILFNSITIGYSAGIMNSANNHPAFSIAFEDVFGDGKTEFAIYPNPVRNEAVVTFPKKVDLIVILNIVGREVLTFVPEPNSEEMRINLSELQPGVYFIAGQSNGAKLFTKRFLKES